MLLLARSWGELQLQLVIAPLYCDAGFLSDFEGFDRICVVVDVLDLLARKFDNDITAL